MDEYGKGMIEYEEFDEEDFAKDFVKALEVWMAKQLSFVQWLIAHNRY